MRLKWGRLPNKSLTHPAGRLLFDVSPGAPSGPSSYECIHTCGQAVPGTTPLQFPLRTPPSQGRSPVACSLASTSPPLTSFLHGTAHPRLRSPNLLCERFLDRSGFTRDRALHSPNRFCHARENRLILPRSM